MVGSQLMPDTVNVLSNTSNLFHIIGAYADFPKVSSKKTDKNVFYFVASTTLCLKKNVNDVAHYNFNAH